MGDIKRRDLEIESDYNDWAQNLINVIQKNKNADTNECLIQNFNRVEDLYEMIQSKEKLNVEKYQKDS